MDKQQILFRIVYALHHIHEYESLLCHDEAKCHNLSVAEDVLFDVKLQLEKELYGEEKANV